MRAHHLHMLAAPVAVVALIALATVDVARAQGGAPVAAAADTKVWSNFDFVPGDSVAWTKQSPHGSITFGAKDPGAHDGNAVALLWKANTGATTPGGQATEIGTPMTLGCGEYRFRTRLAT